VAERHLLFFVGWFGRQKASNAKQFYFYSLAIRSNAQMAFLLLD